MKRFILIFFTLAVLLGTADARRRWVPAIAITGGGTPALIASDIASASDTGSFPARDMTGANAIAVFVKWFSGGTFTNVTDDSGTTYTAGSGDSDGRWYVALNATVDSSVTVTVNGTTLFFNAVMFAVSNVATSSATDGYSRATIQSSPAGAGSITPTTNGCMLLSAILWDNPATLPSVDSGFTKISESNVYIDGATLVQTTAAAINPQWTWTSNTATISILALKHN